MSPLTPQEPENQQAPANAPPFVDTPVLQARRRAFDNPTIVAIDALIAAVRAEQAAAPASAPPELLRLAAEENARLREQIAAFQRREAALRALIEEPHYQGAPLLAGQRDTSVAMVSAEWYGRLRAALASPDPQQGSVDCGDAAGTPHPLKEH